MKSKRCFLQGCFKFILLIMRCSILIIFLVDDRYLLIATIFRVSGELKGEITCG